MESRVDYLKLRTGASFSIPFEESVVFATNLDPEDLMDPAFLRRLPYKIEVGPPNLDQFRRIFERECERHDMTLSDEVFNFIVYMITKKKGWSSLDSNRRSSSTRWWRPAAFWARTRSSNRPISITRSTICASANPQRRSAPGRTARKWLA